MTSTRLTGLFEPLVEIIQLLGGVVVMGFGTWLLTQGHLTIGELLVFLTFLSQMYGPIRDLSDLANEVYAASASAERIIEFFDEEPAVRDGSRSLGRA